MNDPRDAAYLHHIEDAIGKIEKYTAGMTSYEEFAGSDMVQDAVIRQIQVIGEAVKRLSPGFKISASAVPWKEIAGMRDKVVHDYMGVSIRAVWEAVKKDIPSLRSAIRGIL